ncbi:hypothetical protein CSC82_22350 [Rhodobacteraceae bacterium 4F10]|nr:hypothetical protein CSC82_22350 [Rhodobacteraceae bacterium 4F10]
MITRNNNYFIDGCLIANSIEQAIELVEGNDAFIIGGAQIYKEALKQNLVDRLDITVLHHEFEADAFFPKIDMNIWKEVAREDFKADEKNKYDYSFVSYEKRKG